MKFPTQTSPHIGGQNSIGKVMRQVLYALVPGLLLLFWFYGWGIVINLLIAAVTAIGAEALMLKLRDRPIQRTLADNSALLTAVLLAIALPPIAPWWLTVTGSLFAIVLAKHLYGGIGYNPFNPAMVGYVVLLVSFPLQMTQWLPAAAGELPGNPSLLASLQITFGMLPSIDAYTAATPLDHMKTNLGLAVTASEIVETHPQPYGALGGRGIEWINLAFLGGGLWMLWRRIINWQIPAGVLAGLALPATLAFMIDPDQFTAPTFHLFAGATMLAAFFIATDPVSAATTPKGRLIFGFGIGLLTWVIRSFGGYPDGFAFAVLLMNMAVPLIDYYTRPPVFGEQPQADRDERE